MIAGLVSTLMSILFFLGIAFIAYFFLKKTELFQKLEPVVISKRLGWTLAIALLALNIFAYDVVPGLGLGLFYLALCSALLLIFEKRSPLIYGVGILGSVAGLLFAFRSNEVLLQINMVIANLSVLLLIVLHTFGKMQWSGLWLIKNAGLYLLSAFKHIFSIFVGAKDRSSRAMKFFFEFFKISIITFIILIIFVELLSNADPVFNQLIQEVKEEAIGRTFLSLFLGIAFFFVLTLRIRSNSEETKLKILGFYDVAIPSGALALLLGFFLFVQAKYLFGSHESVQVFDLTYAEYVRKGFVELLVATFLGGLISYLLLLKIKSLDALKKIRSLQVINALLVVELALLLLSAFQRDLIYVDVYGYTRIRVIGLAFLIWLAAVLVQLFSFNLFRKWKEMYLFSGIFAISVAGFVVLNVLNVDLMIAKANLAREEKTDTTYNALLSYDAHETWVDLVESSYQRYEALREKTSFTEEEIHDLADAEATLLALTYKIQELEQIFEWTEETQETMDPRIYNQYSRVNDLEQIQKWQSHHWSTAEAYKTLQNNEEWLNDLRICLLTEMADLRWNFDYNSSYKDYSYNLELGQVVAASHYSPLLKGSITSSNYYEKPIRNQIDGTYIAPDPATSCASALPST